MEGEDKYTFGGLPRFRFGFSGSSAAAAPAARVFLFLLPGGRPRLRLTGASEAGAAVDGPIKGSC